MPDYVAIHDKIRDAMLEKTATHFGKNVQRVNTYTSAPLSDMEQLKKAVELLLEKVTSLDRYVRGHRFPPGEYEGKTYQEKEAAIRALEAKEIK